MTGLGFYDCRNPITPRFAGAKNKTLGASSATFVRLKLCVKIPTGRIALEVQPGMFLRFTPDLKINRPDRNVYYKLHRML
jgi:hypothetical protein